MGQMATSQTGQPIGGSRVLWQLTGANMNSTADQAFVKQGTFTNFLIEEIRAVNASTSLSLAVGGIYDTASKGGVPLVANTQVFSALTGSTLGVVLTMAAKGSGLMSAAALYLALTTGQGGAATADIYIIGCVLS